MMIVIESLVRAFEALLTREARPVRGTGGAAANDNTEMADEERCWASLR